MYTPDDRHRVRKDWEDANARAMALYEEIKELSDSMEKSYLDFIMATGNGTSNESLGDFTKKTRESLGIINSKTVERGQILNKIMMMERILGIH